MEESRDLSNLFHLAGGRHQRVVGNTQQKLGRRLGEIPTWMWVFVGGWRTEKHTLPNTNMDTKKDSLEKATPF